MRKADLFTGTRLSTVLAAVLLSLTGAAQAQTSAPRVQTAAGPVEGFHKGAAVQFLGIPYAAPPVGPLRWRPPQAVAAWQGVRPVTQFGPACAQINPLGVFAGPANNNEDCLYLNVVAPRSARPERDRLPVFVWIHGGYVDGGSKLAVAGGAIVVTEVYVKLDGT